MKLLTVEIMKRLPQDTRNIKDPPALVKFFNPAGSGTWYGAEAVAYLTDGREVALSELKPADLDNPALVEDVIFYGAADIHEFELGSFSYRELRSFKGPFGLGIERDMHFSPTPLSQCRGKRWLRS